MKDGGSGLWVAKSDGMSIRRPSWDDGRLGLIQYEPLAYPPGVNALLGDLSAKIMM
jgi:hypothetical protein